MIDMQKQLIEQLQKKLEQKDLENKKLQERIQEGVARL